jgi:hypothetical protein
VTDSTINTVAFNPQIPELFALACDDKTIRVYYPKSFIVDQMDLNIKEV